MKQEKRNILNSITKRWVAVFCIVCMLASVCFNEALVSAEETTTETAATTEDPYHTDELKTEYAQWSLADVGMDSVTNATQDAYSDASKGADSLDKTIFNAKITFPDFAGQFGRFYIGGKQDKTGFVFRNRSTKGTTDLRLQILYYHPTTGETHQYTIADFLEDDLGGLKIRGNEHLSVSLTVDYVDEYTIKGIEYVALKVGVFFNGARVGYYTTTNTGTKLVAPKSALSQRVYCQYQNAAYSIVSEDVWGEQKLYEQDSEWDYWTLSDVGVDDKTVTGDGSTQSYTRSDSLGSSLDKSIFTAKINFPTAKNGRWYIGSKTDTKDNGLVFRTDSDTSKLYLQYKNASATPNTVAIATLDSTTAGVTLRGNDDLTVSVSVEYLSTEIVDEIEYATLKIGVFFNGKLYNNTYFETDTSGAAIKVPTSILEKKVYFYTQNDYAIASNYLWERTRTYDEAILKQEGWDYWTLSDVGVDDKEVTGDGSTQSYTRSDSLGTSLDKSIFTAKINFPTAKNGRWYIGSKTDTKDNGLVFRTDSDTSKLYLQYKNASATPNTVAIATLDSTTAGVTLRGNDDLTVSVSVEYLSTEIVDEIEYATLKIGVFFNGKLYNNTYFETDTSGAAIKVPTSILEKKVYFYTQNDYAIASNHLWERTYDEASLNKDGWDYWTLSDVGVDDKAVTGDGSTQSYTRSDSLGTSLDKSIFTAKINFPTAKNGRWYIGSKTDTKDNGLVFRTDSDTSKLYLQYKNASATPNTVAIATLDSTTAGVTLRGNDNLTVSVSVEYLSTEIVDEIEYATLRIGVFFNGKLYNNTYFETDTSGAAIKVPTSILEKKVYFYTQNDYAVASAYNRIAELPPSWDVAKLSDFNINDGAYSNSAEEMTVNSYGVATNTGAFDHLAIGGEFLFKETANAYVNIGGADSNKGLKLYSDVETGSLKLEAVSDSSTCVEMTSNVAGTTLVGEPVHIDITSRFVDMDGDDVYNDLKLGVYFNGLLYNATYYYYKDYITNGEFGNYLGFYTDDGGKVCVASEYTVDATQKTYDLTNGVYTTFKDEIEYAKLGEWIRTPLDSTNGLDIPGEYEISQYQGMKKESLDIYMTSDSNTDGIVDIRDLVSVKKAKQNTDDNKTLSTIQALSVDSDSDGKISDDEVKKIVTKLLFSDSSVAALCYETGVMPIGGYFGPSYYNAECNTLTNDVFKAIKDAGVDLIVSTNVKESSENSQINDVLQLAANNNLGVYINADNFTTKESVSDSDLTDLNNTYSKYTSFKGVYLVDEPYLESVYGDTDHESLSKYSSVATLLNSTTNLLGWANLFPKQDDLNLSSSLSLDESYRNYLNEYVKKYQPKFLSFDQYVWGSTETEVNHNSEQIQRNKMYFSALADVRNVADSSNIPFWTVIQAGGNWNDAKDELDVKAPYAVPSEGQLLWNVNTSLAYGAKGLTYFPLVQPQHFALSTGGTMDYARNGLIGADGSLTQWYGLAQKANKQVATVDEVLMESSSVRVLAEGYYAEKETEITNDFDGLDLKSITVETETTDYSYDAWPWGKREYGAVVGVFDYYGKEAYYVVNYDYMAAREVTLNFASSTSYKVLAEDSNCTSTKGEGSGTSCSLSLTAGGAALVVVE